MLASFDARVAARTATPFALRTMAVVEALEAAVAALAPEGGFEPPRTPGPGIREFGKLPLQLAVSEWSSAAHKLAEKEVDPGPNEKRTPNP